MKNADSNPELGLVALMMMSRALRRFPVRRRRTERRPLEGRSLRLQGNRGTKAAHAFSMDRSVS